MPKDSLETLLLRHYGDTAPVPTGLQERLCATVYQQAHQLDQEQQVAAHLRQKRISRRHAVRIVAIGTAGLGILSAGLEVFEAALGSQQDTQQAFS